MVPLTPHPIDPLIGSFLGPLANDDGVIEVGGGQCQIRLEASPSLIACHESDAGENAMPSSISDAKRSSSIQDTAAERWARLYVDVRASYGRAAIQAALLLNGGASVALLAFLGNLAIAHQTMAVTGSIVAFTYAFLCFGIGVMLAASSSVVAFLIQNVAIAHLTEAEGKLGRRLRSVGIGMVVAALISFAVGITVASNAMENLIGSFGVIAQ